MISSSQRGLRKPAPLRRPARVAALAISSPSDLARIQAAAANLRNKGLDVVLADNIDHSHNRYLAGTDDHRLQTLNDALRDPSYAALLFARGGYGAMRILEGVDYGAMVANPRPLIGYSDVTALHQAAAVKAGIGSFHGPMLNTDFHDGLSPEIEGWFWDVLEGRTPLWGLSAEQVLAPGSAEGVLFGGCLSLTVALMGTPFDFWVEDGIWFWEDVSEPAYRIDRMLTHLHLSGRLRKIKGVMIGRLKDCGGGSPDELDHLLSEFFERSGIPVFHHLPFGHHADNLLMPIGTTVRIDSRRATFQLLEPAVAQ